MKKTIIILMSIGLIAACGKKKVKKGGALPCKKDSIKKSKDGKILKCKLKKDYETHGVPCKKDTVIDFHKNGLLKSCDMSKGATVQGFPCKKSISFDKKGKVYYCSKTSKEFKAGGATIPKDSTMNAFGDGVVRYASTNKGGKIKFNGFKCSTMDFNKAGKPKKCKTIGKIKIKGKDVPAKSKVCFDDAGKTTNGSGCFKF
jgi:hypothetical protein